MSVNSWIFIAKLITGVFLIVYNRTLINGNVLLSYGPS